MYTLSTISFRRQLAKTLLRTNTKPTENDFNRGIYNFVNASPAAM